MKYLIFAIFNIFISNSLYSQELILKDITLKKIKIDSLNFFNNYSNRGVNYAFIFASSDTLYTINYKTWGIPLLMKKQGVLGNFLLKLNKKYTLILQESNVKNLMPCDFYLHNIKNYVLSNTVSTLEESDDYCFTNYHVDYNNRIYQVENIIGAKPFIYP